VGIQRDREILIKTNYHTDQYPEVVIRIIWPLFIIDKTVSSIAFLW